MLSQNTYNELNVLLNCDHEHATASQCANCICGERDEENFKFRCRYDKVLSKTFAHFAAIHDPIETESEEKSDV